MASTSRKNSATNIIENKSSNRKYLIHKIQQFLMSTPHMTKMKLLQLYKLLELSYNLDVKLYLIKIFLPKAKDILNNESSQYAKEKLLEIIASICHIEEAIEMMGNDTELVNYIFCCFGICHNNFRLQKTLFKLLSLLTCEIHSNSKWIHHLTNSRNHTLGPNILRILTEDTADSSFMEIISFLELLSELTMPDSTSSLEHLFKIDDLISALLRWFSESFVRKRCPHCNKQFWILIEKWLKIITAITKLHSFRRDSYENDIHRSCILTAINVIPHTIRTLVSDIEVESPVRRTTLLSLLTAPSIGAIYRSITLFLSFSSDYDFLPASVEAIVEVSSKIEEFFEFETLGNSETEEVRHSLEIFLKTIRHLYIVVHTRDWSSKNILELVFLWHNAYPNRYTSFITILDVIELCNLPYNVRHKLDNLVTLKTGLWYLLYTN